MSKYKVKLYYSTFCEVEVEADNREEAVDAAYCKCESEECTKQLIGNLQQCQDEDVELLENNYQNEMGDDAYVAMVGIKDKYDMLGRPQDNIGTSLRLNFTNLG